MDDKPPADDATTPAPPPRAAGKERPVRQVDARSLRALAHPLRMRLLQMLRDDGPATATVLSAQVGQKTGTVSWHLRHLAEHRLIEEDLERGTRRERWWRATPDELHLSTAELRTDPASAAVVAVYLDQYAQQSFDRVRRYLAEPPWPDAWQGTATFSDWNDLRLGPAAARQLAVDLAAVVDRYSSVEDATPDALPVTVQLQSFPRRSRSDR